MSLSRALKVWPYLAIFAWPLLAWAAAWAHGLILAPGDGWGQYLPQRIGAAAAIRAGEWPFWNPFQFSGMPLLAVSQTGLFFPGNWTFLLLPAGLAMNLTVLLAYWVAGFSCWAYARAIQMPPAAAVLCAWVFMGCGHMVANMEHVTVIQAAGLIPALFWAVERTVQTRQPQYPRWLALLLALQIFSGYPQTVMMSALLVAPYALWRFSNASAFDFRALGRLAGAALLGVGIATLQWLPTLDLLAASDRHTMSYAALTDDSWPLREVLTLVFPFLYGNLPNELFTVPFWGKGPWRNELMGYASLLTLVLAGIGAFRAWRNPLAAYWGVVGTLGALLALGAQTPLYKIWHALPIFGMVRVPARHLLEVDLALAVLAGLGLAQLLELYNTRRRQLVTRASLIFGLGFLTLAVSLLAARFTFAAKWQMYAPAGVDVAAAMAPTQAWFWVQALLALSTLASLWALVRWPHGRGISAILLVLALDLGIFGYYQGWRTLLPAHTDLQPAPLTAQLDAPRFLSIPGQPYPYHDIAHTRATLYPQTNILVGEKAVNGYEPLLASHYSRLVGGMAMGGALGRVDLLTSESRVLDLLQCQTVRLHNSFVNSEAGSLLQKAPWRLLQEENDVLYFENTRPLARAWRPTESHVASETEIARWLRGEIGGRTFGEAWLTAPLSKKTLAAGSVKVTTTRFNEIQVQTLGAGPGLVVISEAHAPGWRAWGSSGELPVHRVNGLLLGVEVPAGSHQIHLRYAPERWNMALAVSGTCALLWLFGWAPRPRRYRMMTPR